MLTEVQSGDRLNCDTVRIGMVCKDLSDDLVLVDRLLDHKHVEVAQWWNGSWAFLNDRVRIDELEFVRWEE